jgi:chromate transport protein ChrA
MVMSPFMKYSLARVGIFVVVAAALFFVPLPISSLLRLLIALLISAILAYFLLGRLRNQVSEQVAGVAQRRVERKERLRSALAGDDTRDETDD